MQGKLHYIEPVQWSTQFPYGGWFFALLKKSLGNPYLKILDFLIFFFNKFCLHPLTALLGHPVQKYFLVFCFNQKHIYTKPS